MHVARPAHKYGSPDRAGRLIAEASRSPMQAAPVLRCWAEAYILGRLTAYGIGFDTAMGPAFWLSREANFR
jgi:hypothetical protein